MHASMGEGKTYLLLGHPSWGGNLDTADEEFARRWFDEFKDEYPVRVDVVETNRHTLLRKSSTPGHVRMGNGDD